MRMETHIKTCTACDDLASLRGDLALWALDCDANQDRYTQGVNDLRRTLDTLRNGCQLEAERLMAIWIIERDASTLIAEHLIGELKRILTR